jgi:hypothetical protein
MGIEFKKNIGELELGLQFLLNFSHEWELEWESPWFLDQLLISGQNTVKWQKTSSFVLFLPNWYYS